MYQILKILFFYGQCKVIKSSKMYAMGTDCSLSRMSRIRNNGMEFFVVFFFM